MNLTGNELVSQNIITGPLEYDNIQQHGVDLNVIDIKLLDPDSRTGFIPAVGKTKLVERQPLELKEIFIDGDNRKVWELKPGAYEVTFSQGCFVPNNQRLQIIQRSSLLRNGGILRSSVFDAGFQTNNIGTVIILSNSIIIEYNARIAQIVAELSNEVTNLYNGQWQGK